MKKQLFLILVLSALTLSGCTPSGSGFEKLDQWTQTWKEAQKTYFGYQVNEHSALDDFYQWYVSSGMDAINLNNAGDPMTDNPWNMSTQAFEKEVIEFFTPLYGFDKDDVWGIVTHSGTDGKLFNLTGAQVK